MWIFKDQISKLKIWFTVKKIDNNFIATDCTFKECCGFGTSKEEAINNLMKDVLMFLDGVQDNSKIAIYDINDLNIYDAVMEYNTKKAPITIDFILLKYSDKFVTSYELDNGIIFVS